MSNSQSVDRARRFGGVARLYGEAALARLQQARVVVAGIGGVGSWVVEALARSGVGHLRLIDLDHVAESNINRQIHALDDTLGQAKIEAMAARIRLIDPGIVVECIDDFVTEANVATTLAGPVDLVVDAIDDLSAKAAIVLHCRRHGIRLITLGAAGGQTDPTRIVIGDLSRTEQDPLLARLRKRLRQKHGFSRNSGRRFGIDAVYSTEPLRYPEGSCDAVVGPAGLNCAGFGSSIAVTASFGLAAASRAIDRLLVAAPAPDSAQE
ncbi:tRNA threonylcarbamoyladenosine dehydratase [Denitromonas ohlonensis]|uniref:tRNA threonylcarbamoyladenosine dehydratase n=2 Tax=Denitromonas TaxID=139331 RepID=A0A557RBU3_9RHOO|nr:tRNA threonylcarbamoyladenosine dehydratase [Denitromonas ohlonensis]TVO62623.1 tRNA threonylcarbamoyladenosine dehydratase [Denitromonas ohlonensis]TVO78827.1 tRNA threonylcarbamoyladenosine dehydratase [Denitromonas ohlonensis]